MPKRTNPFQKMTAAIVAVFHEPDYSVEESVLEQNPRTGVIREIDIRVVHRKNPNDRIMIECRAHRRIQHVEWIDALAGKSRSLGFPRTIAVSASGFSKAAVTEARDRGIEVLHLRKAEEQDWRKWMFAINNLSVCSQRPTITNVALGIDAQWPGNPPKDFDMAKVLLMDKRDGTRIPLRKYLDDLVQAPNSKAKLRALARKENTPLLKAVNRIPCAPEMGYVIEGIEEFIPLVEIVVDVDFSTSNYDMPLQHMRMGNERVIVGQTPVDGIDTRVVVHEQADSLSLLFEGPGKPQIELQATISEACTQGSFDDPKKSP